MPPPPSPAPIQVLQHAIEELEARRVLLGDEVVDAALGPLRERLAALRVSAPPDTAATPAAPERRLRQVSVLFVDLVGSTTLVQRLDPEDVQAVIDAALGAFADIVVQGGGEVLRYAGDGLKAAFGADLSREDDAERAVRCGLALLQEAARRGDDVRRVHGHEGFGARVGIHTGPVVRGGGIENEQSLSGLAVHVAARMEQAAAPGTLRISVDTFRQVQGRFEVEEQPLLAVKGLQQPMRTYLVRAEYERRLHGLHHGADDVATPLLGRAAEQAGLQALLKTAVDDSTLAAATLLGEAGLGKSRLLADFQASLPAPVRAASLWRASGHPQGRHQPCGLLRDLLFWHHGIKDSDSQAEAQQRFAAALAPLFGAAADEQTALLGQLIGLDYRHSPFVAGILRDGRQLRARGFHAWTEYLRLQATRQPAGQPLVLMLDDLQWADDQTLDAIDHLVAEATSLPLLLLCAGRPELLERRPDWGTRWPTHRRQSLTPLPGDARDALASALLQRLAQPSPRLHRLLAEQAAGNPYYMEALLQMLLDTGVIATGGGHGAQAWVVDEDRLHDLQVPATLVGVLQATLDALAQSERWSLQQASVIGAQFWDQALAALDADAPRALPVLARRELALPQARSAFEGTQAYAFRHHLLHQVTYGTVLKAERREGHGRAARWLQARCGERNLEMAGQIAEHFEQAGLRDDALTHWLLAAEDASRRQADSAALAHAERALALDDGSDLPRTVRIRRVRAQVFMRASRAAEHDAELDLLQALADRLDDDVLRLVIANDRGWRFCLTARFDEAVALGEACLTRAAGRSPGDAARVHNVMFIAYSRLGRFDEAMAHGRRALALAVSAGDRASEGSIHNNIGVNLIDAHEQGQAQEHLQQALSAYQAAGSRYGIVTVMCNLALSAEHLCQFERARDLLLQTLQICREIGARGMEAMAHANLSYTLTEMGDAQAGLDSARRSIELCRTTGDRWAQAQGEGGAFVSAHALGRWADARVHACAAHALFADHGHRELVWAYRAAAALMLDRLHEPARARAEADTLLADVAAEPDGWGEFIEAPLFLHQLLAAQADDRAPGLLAVAHHNLQRLADRHVAWVPRDTFVRATIVRRAILDAWAAAAPA